MIHRIESYFFNGENTCSFCFTLVLYARSHTVWLTKQVIKSSPLFDYLLPLSIRILLCPGLKSIIFVITERRVNY